MNENYGSAVGESLACGTPVVVGPTNGTRDYIAHDSRVAAEYTEIAVSAAIADVIAIRRRSSEPFSLPSRTIAEQELSVEAVVDRLSLAVRATLQSETAMPR